jgi:hypothetical protein
LNAAFSAVSLIVVQAVGGGPHCSNSMSGGLGLSPEVSKLCGELLYRSFL